MAFQPIAPQYGAQDYRNVALPQLETFLDPRGTDPQGIVNAATGAHASWYSLATTLRGLIPGNDGNLAGPGTFDGIVKKLLGDGTGTNGTWTGAAAKEFASQAKIVRDYGCQIMQRAYDKGTEESVNGIGSSMHSVTEAVGTTLTTAQGFYTQLQKTRTDWAKRVQGQIFQRLDGWFSNGGNTLLSWAVVDDDADLGTTAGYFTTSPGMTPESSYPEPTAIELFHFPVGFQGTASPPAINQSVASVVGSDIHTTLPVSVGSGGERTDITQTLMNDFQEPYRVQVAAVLQWLANAYAATKFPDQVDTTNLPGGAGNGNNGYGTNGYGNGTGTNGFGGANTGTNPYSTKGLTSSQGTATGNPSGTTPFGTNGSTMPTSSSSFPTTGTSSPYDPSLLNPTKLADATGTGSGLGGTFTPGTGTGGLFGAGTGGGGGLSPGTGGGLGSGLGSAGTGAGAAELGAAGAAARTPMMPMQPGAGGGQNGKERQRQSWLPEDDEVWGADSGAAPPVL